MSLSGVIFDMDGVLVDSEPVHIKAERELLEGLGIDFDKVDIKKYVGLAMDKFWEAMKNEYNLDKSVEDLLAYDTEIRSKAFREYADFKAPEGSKALVRTIKRAGLPIALASSSHTNLIDVVIDKLNYRRFFDVVISGFELKNGKPAPDIFLYSADMLGTKPAETLVIEDSANGVLAAKSAGMKCLGYKNPHSGNQDLSLADFITDDFESITLDTLEKIMEM